MEHFLLLIALYHLVAFAYAQLVSSFRPKWADTRGWVGLLVALPVIPLIPAVLLLTGLSAALRAMWSDARDYYRDLRGLFT